MSEKHSKIILLINTNNDRKKLLEIDINNISIKQIEMEKIITGLNTNTSKIQIEQQYKIDLINVKCKELEELGNTIENKLYKESISEIILSYKDIVRKLSNTIFNDKLLKHCLIEMYIKYISSGIIFKGNKIFNIKDNNYFTNLMKDNILKLQHDTLAVARRDHFHRFKTPMVEPAVYNYNITQYSYNEYNKDIPPKMHIYNTISHTINNMNKILEEKKLQDTIYFTESNKYSYTNFYADVYKQWFNQIEKELKEKYYSIDNLFDSYEEKLLFINYIINDSIENNIIVYLEMYNKLTINNLLYDFQVIKELALKKNKYNIYDNNIKISADEHSAFIKVNKLNINIKKIKEMEITISNELEKYNERDNKYLILQIEKIEKYVKLTGMLKNIKNEIYNNIQELSTLELDSKEYERKNLIIKHTNLNQEYFSKLTKLISNILKKPLLIITIDNINIYTEKVLLLETKAKEAHKNIILLCKFINELLINLHNNIKIIQTSIKKEIELNIIISKNVDLIKQKNEEIQQILIQNKKLYDDVNKYNIELNIIISKNVDIIKQKE